MLVFIIKINIIYVVHICLSEIDIHVPSFGGNSYLQYIGLRRSLLMFANIEIVFRSTSSDGLLLYNGYATDGSGDFISLALHNGSLEYRFDLGTGPAIVRYANLAPGSAGIMYHLVRLASCQIIISMKLPYNYIEHYVKNTTVGQINFISDDLNVILQC